MFCRLIDPIHRLPLCRLQHRDEREQVTIEGHIGASVLSLSNALMVAGSPNTKSSGLG